MQAPAGGWIKDLYKGEDAIIAKVEWTPKAAEYLKNKEYRYLSPVVLVRKRDQKATAIHSVALTNTPAIDGMFALVNSLDIEDISEGGNIMDLKELAKALGLPETATEEEIKKAVEDAAKAAEKLKEMDGKKPGEGDGKPGDGEPKPEGADMVANSTILSMLGLKADAKTEDVAASIMALKAGTPDAYDIVVEVMDAGECNEGSFRYSLDGGNTFTEEMTIPITGEAELATTGLTAKFTDAEGGDSFMEGDRFTFSTTSPAMSNESVISAVESLINSPLMFEFVHIVGVSSKALWASLCTIANDFLTKYKRPLFFVCEARGKKADESLEDYVNAMLEERKGINNIYMQVVCSNSRYQRMDGRVQDINNAGIVTGLYGRAKESQSIGEVKSFPISEAKLLKLLPEGIEDYIETLDKAKYVTIRQYIGKEDYYVTSANMMSPEGSDYSYAEDVRVSNRLVKAVRAKALDELQVEVDPEDIETSITNIQEQLNTPVEDAVRDKIISSGSVTIDTENLNILVDEKLDINITYVPMGHVREMNLTFAVENPYSAS